MLSPLRVASGWYEYQTPPSDQTGNSFSAHSDVPGTVPSGATLVPFTHLLLRFLFSEFLRQREYGCSWAHPVYEYDEVSVLKPLVSRKVIHYLAKYLFLARICDTQTEVERPEQRFSPSCIILSPHHHVCPSSGYCRYHLTPAVKVFHIVIICHHRVSKLNGTSADLNALGIKIILIINIYNTHNHVRGQLQPFLPLPIFPYPINAILFTNVISAQPKDSVFRCGQTITFCQTFCTSLTWNNYYAGNGNINISSQRTENNNQPTSGSYRYGTGEYRRRS